MIRPSLLAATALVLALAGCTPGGTPTNAPTDPAPPATPTSEPAPEAQEIILGVHGVRVLDGDEDVAYSREDPEAVIARFTELFGEPTFTDTDYSDLYEWDGVTVFSSGWATVRFDVAELDGWTLHTSEGISVGSTRDEVMALSPLDDGYDGDGDGLSDHLGLEAEPEPDTESLTNPGEVGTSYIDALFLDGDVVSALIAPGGDWRDV